MWLRIRAPFTDDETPWCAGFVGSCLEEAGIKSSRSALALSYARWGQFLAQPAVGAIAYKARKNAAGKLVGGHVGFVVGKAADGRIMLLSGNAADRVGIDAYAVSGILGYRWPPSLALPSSTLPILRAVGDRPVSEA